MTNKAVTGVQGIYKLSDVATLTCDPYQGCQLSSTLGKIHYQVCFRPCRRYKPQQ